jgi:hypothetical protein
METQRRDFLKRASLAGLSLGAVAVAAHTAPADERGADKTPKCRCELFISQPALENLSDDDAKKLFADTCGPVLFNAFKAAKDAGTKLKDVPRGPDVSIGCTGSSSGGVSCTGTVTWHL